MREELEDICINFFSSAPPLSNIEITKEILNKIRDKSITHNTFRMQDYDSIMTGLYCIAFIEHLLSAKTLLDYTISFSPNDYKKN